ncbi:hypothetical protein [Nocardia ninae]|nr:hypothetical protein [Nocardia ninae]
MPEPTKDITSTPAGSRHHCTPTGFDKQIDASEGGRDRLVSGGERERGVDANFKKHHTDRVGNRQSLRGVVMAGGFYNHYDDPDEHWDEEPLRPTPKARPADSIAQPRTTPSPSFGPAPAAPTDPVELPTTSSAHSTFSGSASRPDQPADLPGFGSLLDDLAKFHGYTRAISDLMQEAFSAGPSNTTAHDSTGAVQVTVTGTGELNQVVVSENWHLYLDQNGIGPAFVQAVKNAEIKRLELTSIAAAENGTIDRLEELDITSATPTSFSPPQPSHYQPVSVEQMLEKALRKLDGDPTESKVGEFTASVGGENELYASITLNKNGIVDCSVRIPWGMDAGGGRIALAISESYNQAYRQRITSNDGDSEISPSTLIGEAIQAIANLQIHPPSDAR